MAEASYQTILVDKTNGITTITFNRPEQRNAMSPQLHRDMYAALNELRYDPDTRVIILTGAGPSFCAGQDLKQYFMEMDAQPQSVRDEVRNLSRRWRNELIRTMPQPVIAKINGWCFGGGFTIVTAADIAIAVETDEQWRALGGLLGPEAAGDRRFESVEGRMRHRAELHGLIERWTGERDAYEVMELLHRAGIPCGVAQNGADLVSDPHLKERGFIVEVENRRLGRVVLPSFPLRFANSAISHRWEFPELGRDNEEVLRGLLGYGEERIARLVNDGVLE